MTQSPERPALRLERCCRSGIRRFIGRPRLQPHGIRFHIRTTALVRAKLFPSAGLSVRTKDFYLTCGRNFAVVPFSGQLHNSWLGVRDRFETVETICNVWERRRPH